MGRKFYHALKALAAKLGCQPQDLLAVIYMESKCNPAAFNKSSSAVGLIQFLPSTLRAVGYTGTTYDFQRLSAWEQVPYIDTYLSRVSAAFGSLSDVIRLYKAVLYPASLGNLGTAVLIAGSAAYQANKNLDVNRDGVVDDEDLRRLFDGIEASDGFDKYVTEMMNDAPIWAPDVIAEMALRYVDVGNTLDVDRYLEIMAGPGDDDATRRYLLAGPSTCALFARGVWRQAGVEASILSSKYRIGAAVSDIVSIARLHNAWYSNPKELIKGDVCLLAEPEHVIVVISDPVWVERNILAFSTIEGGQAPNSSFVRRFDRRLELKDGKLYSAGKYTSWVRGRADACELLPTDPYSGPEGEPHVMNHPVVNPSDFIP